MLQLCRHCDIFCYSMMPHQFDGSDFRGRNPSLPAPEAFRRTTTFFVPLSGGLVVLPDYFATALSILEYNRV